MKKIYVLMMIFFLTLSSIVYAEKEFDVESCQPGKTYWWSSTDAEDDVGIINSTTKARYIKIQVEAHSPSGVTFNFPCENDQKELQPGKAIVCLLKPYYKGSGKGYIISWITKGNVGKPKIAKGTLVVQF